MPPQKSRPFIPKTGNPATKKAVSSPTQEYEQIWMGKVDWLGNWPVLVMRQLDDLRAAPTMLSVTAKGGVEKVSHGAKVTDPDTGESVGPRLVLFAGTAKGNGRLVDWDEEFISFEGDPGAVLSFQVFKSQ